jgi:hypothetical protein
MVSHMKTTLNLDSHLMVRLKQEAAAQGRTMSDLFESALRLILEKRPPARKIAPLPTFAGGHPRANIANREALEDFMEER